MSAAVLFWWLLVGHAVGDYPLQPDFLARGKNLTAPLAGVPWYQCLAAHALIQAGIVALITGSVWLGVAEFFAHAWTDAAKCVGAFGTGAQMLLDRESRPDHE